MRIVVFGLAVSSSWGNGHATLWRGLIRALHDLGCSVVFFERDVPYYAGASGRDVAAGRRAGALPPWPEASARAAREIAQRRVRHRHVLTAPTRSPLRAWRELRPPVSAFYDLGHAR